MIAPARGWGYVDPTSHKCQRRERLGFLISLLSLAAEGREEWWAPKLPAITARMETISSFEVSLTPGPGVCLLPHDKGPWLLQSIHTIKIRGKKNRHRFQSTLWAPCLWLPA